MTSKTHISTGLVVATALTLPATWKGLAICSAAATIGSIISDIDVTTSESHKDLVKILVISIIAIFLCCLAENFFHLGILQFILSETNLSRILIGLLIFLLICSFGMHQPHRTFMHSIPCTIILSASVFTILPAAVFPFALGMLSHIILDLFNKKKVQILYPLKLKIGFKLCSANGKVNNSICFAASSLFLMEIGIFVAHLYNI